jgi:hypothetical protein
MVYRGSPSEWAFLETGFHRMSVKGLMSGLTERQAMKNAASKSRAAFFCNSREKLYTPPLEHQT